MLPYHIWKFDKLTLCSRYLDGGNRCLCAVGVEYSYYQGLHSIPDLTFCAVNCTIRHLFSSDLNKSCRPGLLVLVSNRCLCAVGVEYRYYQGLHSIPDLTFCAVNCTTRHLVSSDLNKSCRPGLLVLVSYIKCLKSMCNSCTHLSTVTIYPKVYYMLFSQLVLINIF